MKKLLLILFIVSSYFNSKGAIHQIQVWDGYYQFLPPNNITVQLGDTIQWIPLDPPPMTHTITSNNIPVGAVSFNQIWQLPADTFFQYIPQVAGLYQYVCTPHISFGMIGEFTVVNGTTSQKTYVPDNNFEQALINLGYDNILDDSVLTANINTVTILSIQALNISDLTGIEDFTALADLYCSGNLLTSLDVSTNTALDYLSCASNYLTSLDVSVNTALTYLNCGNNQLLTSLDVSTNTALTSLSCNFNPFTSLDLSQNTALTELQCIGNLLTNLDVSLNTAFLYLDCRMNQLITLDVSQNTALNYLICSENQLTSLDVSQNTALTSLWCYDNQLTSLDVSANTALDYLSCQNNQLTTLNISNNVNLVSLTCQNNQLATLDLRNGNNQNMAITSTSIGFNITNNPSLYCIDVDNVVWAGINWTVSNSNIDPWMNFSGNCSFTTNGCADLFFSEYIEGVGNNTAIEIYNPTNSVVDLSNYSIDKYLGALTPMQVSFQLSGLINPFDVVVIANGQLDSIWVGGLNPFWSLPIDTALYNLADLYADTIYPSALHIDGDDALVLSKNGIPIDIFGSIGIDPGFGWTTDVSANYTTNNGAVPLTVDHTLIRKTNVMQGISVNPPLFNPTTEWDVFSLNTWSNLGYHNSSCSSCFIAGCTDSLACNYDSTATTNNSSCVYPTSGSSSVTACDSYAWEGQTVTSSQVLIHTYTNVTGCDSTHTLSVTIINSTISTDTQIACDNYIWLDGVTYTTSNNTAAFTSTNGGGCVNVATLDLTITNSTSSFDTLSITASIVWNGLPLSVSGDYSVTLINLVGCDSIVNLNLTVTTTGISDIANNKSTLVKITDMLGQETPYRKNTPLFYIFDDGTVEKRIVIE